MRILLSAFMIFLIASGCKETEKELIKKADRIHKAILTVDTHCDTPLRMAGSDFDPGKRDDEGCVDFPRMKEGGLDAEFFAVFLSQGPRNDSAYKAVYKETLRIIDTVHRSVARNSALAQLAFSPDDACRLKKEKSLAVFLGIENGYAIGTDLSKIKEYYDLGVRYITLCHTGNNDICDSSVDMKGPEHGGLSGFGTEVVKEMNRLGMMIDVSHISDDSFYDVINETSAPVIASHSSCRALCSSPRNLTDDMLQALKSNGGVIQICILSNYIKTPEPNPELDEKLKELKDKYSSTRDLSEEEKESYQAERSEIQKKYRKLATVSDVVDHIDHVVQVIGIDHVGIGTDFDGGGGVEGCTSVAEMKNITTELLRRAYSKQDIEKIWSGNIMRVFREVEKIAAR
jgi:membrane dipeptidase